MADPRALQFDHITGGGRARQRDGENSHGIIRAILAGSTDFQLLCANCNWIKKAEQEEHGGDRQYGRVVPLERASGPGKGRSGGAARGRAQRWHQARGVR